MTDVFVSYKSEDRARVKPLVDALKAEGLSVWWDLDIEAGAVWRDTIRQQLDMAVCVIVVWSHESTGATGHFVQDEASRAKRRGVYLPVLIDPVEAPLGFGQDQSLSLIGWRGSRRDPQFADVLAAARAIISGGARPVPTARARAIRRSPSGFWPVAGVVVALLAVGVIAFEATSPDEMCAVAGLRCPTLAVAAANSIAVLPLENLSGDPAQEYFADGLTEELIGSLAKLGQFQVVGRTSSFKFKGSKETSASIGAKLGVAYLIDGSVRRDGPTVRVSAQLVDAKSGFERWSNTFDRTTGDSFAVQSDIAQAVAEALKVQLLGADVSALSRGGTANGEAYDSYLRGRQLFDAQGGDASYREALARFDSAIAADPTFALAQAARARALLVIAAQFTSAPNRRATFDEALASARRAVALDANLAASQTVLANALLYAKLDIPGAKQAYARAVAVGGGDADVLLTFGLFSCRIGDIDRGLVAIRRGLLLDPLNPRAYKTLGLALTLARRYPESVTVLRRGLALGPGANLFHGLAGDALFLQGRFSEAKQEYAAEPSDWARLTGQAIVLRRLGDVRGAKVAFDSLVAGHGEGTAYQQAVILAQWGDLDAAFAALETARRAGDPGLVAVASDPLVDPLRADPRFTRLASSIGLKPAN